jgi:amidase
MFDTCGWFARDAAMLSRVGAVLLGERTAPTPGRLLIAHDAFEFAMPEASQALQSAAMRVQSVLGDATPVSVSGDRLAEWFNVFRVLQFGDIWDAHREWVTRVHPKFGPMVALRFQSVAKSDPAAVERMHVARAELRAHLDALLSDNAVLMLPTMPDIAPRLQAPLDETVWFRERSLGLLCIAGLGGLPQISLPMATLNGCPIGLSLVAARGHDEMLLAIARALAS